MTELIQTRVKELFDYDQESGDLVRKTSINGAKKGDVAGGIGGQGYVLISVDGKIYKAHRLVWLWHYGTFPKYTIDHINHKRADNRLSNLRESTQQEQARNSCLNKKSKPGIKRSGITGVSWHSRDKRWVAFITIKNKTVYLGSSKNIKKAAKLRKEANKKYGFHNNHGQVAPFDYQR